MVGTLVGMELFKARRRLDAAFLLGLILNSRPAERPWLARWGAWISRQQGGVEPPQSKALRAADLETAELRPAPGPVFAGMYASPAIDRSQTCQRAARLRHPPKPDTGGSMNQWFNPPCFIMALACFHGVHYQHLPQTKSDFDDHLDCSWTPIMLCGLERPGSDCFNSVLI